MYHYFGSIMCHPFWSDNRIYVCLCCILLIWTDEMLYEEAWENLEKAQEEFEMAKRLLRGRQVRGGRRNNFRGYGY